MPKWFTEDPTTVWGQLTPEMLSKVNRWIGQCETIISTRFPGIQTRVDSGSLSVDAIITVVEGMVTRAIDNEDRDGIVKETLPEWGVEYATGQGLGTGSVLYFTTDEFALLAPSRSGTRISSMRMRRSYEATDPTP